MTEKEWYTQEEPEVIGTCAGCGYEIRKGDPIYRFEGQMIHADDHECLAEFFRAYHELQEEVAE